MKERIVVQIKDETCDDCRFELSGCNRRYPDKISCNILDDRKNWKREQVPESFADLLTLCKDLKDVDIEEADDLDVARIIIHNADLIYFEDEILMVAGFKKLEIKPEKMWQIIKSLIGEK